MKRVVLLCILSVVLSDKSKADDWLKGVFESIDDQHVPLSEDDDFSNVLVATGDDDDLIVDFMLYTRNSPQNSTKLVPGDEASMGNIDLTKDLKLIIHGWRNGYESPLGEILKEAYLKAQDVNVIVLDWSSRSFKNYIGSRMSVTKVGREVASVLDELVNKGLSLNRIHMIGHSLGAHVAGIAGERMTTGRPARVTGLDPAAPMFTVTEYDILKPSSAMFVDVIHTCGYMLGFISPLGHADFYPNKGTPPQPGCGLDYTGECSHSRAYELYADSVKGANRMLAVSCQDATAYAEGRCYGSPVPMGENTPTTARGMFYLETRRRAPFGKGAPKL